MSKESYEQKREEKLKDREGQGRGQKRKNFARNLKILLVLLLAAGALGYGIYSWLKTSGPEGTDYSRAIELMGEEHIAVGSPLPEYNSNPPTSGPHYAQTAAAGYRTEEIPDQHLIHNLEHGDVWISYHPSISDEVKEALRQFDATKVVITPREANDTDIALAGWGRLDKFDLENGELPEQRVEDFIKRYANRGPEQVPGKSMGI